MKLCAILVLASLALIVTHSPAMAGDTVEVHGILEGTTTGMLLVTDASSYMVRGIDASGLEGRRAIVLGDQGEDNGITYIDATVIQIAQ